MLREHTVFAQKIIDFYTDKGVECSVVDEHLSLMVTLNADGRTHEFRYGNRAFGGTRHFKKFYQVLEAEWAKLKEEPAAAAPSARNHTKPKYRNPDDAWEETGANI